MYNNSYTKIQKQYDSSNVIKYFDHELVSLAYLEYNIPREMTNSFEKVLKDVVQVEQRLISDQLEIF